MSDWFDRARTGGPSRASEISDLADAMKMMAEAGERELPGLSVVVLVDKKVVSGDTEESIRAFYHYIAGNNGVSLAADDVILFIGLCVAIYGDNDAIRRAAKAVYDKKGA